MPPSRFVGVGLRAMQFLASLVALLSLLFGFRADSRFGRTTMLGSPTTTLGLLVSYSTMLYSIYRLVAGEPRKAARPLRRAVRALELSVILALLVAAVLLAKSDYLVNCELYGGTVHCARLETATTCLFAAHAASLGSIVLMQRRATDETHHE
jgi:hypothetical protein